MVGEGDEFAVVGGAIGIGHETEDGGGVNGMFSACHEELSFVHCLKNFLTAHNLGAQITS